ncbi:MAG TPA: tetratricopeptide repeat protein [Opitutaceae bacterium]|nr:tetratricopeptide repeat protein [Opitutaceae bacterium]
MTTSDEASAFVAQRPTGPTRRRRLPMLAVAGLFGAIGCAYAGSFGAPFLFDDLGAVVRNPSIRHLDSLSVLRPPADGSTTTGRPVVNVSYAVNYAIGGLHVRGYHVVNVLIHLACALLLFGVVRRTWLAGGGGRRPSAGNVGPPELGTGNPAGAVDRAATAFAFVVALLWALHPLQTETVVSTAQRTESLCALFYLLALYGFVRATPAPVESGSVPGRRSGLGWFAVSWLACGLGMATKEVMVTAPVMIWLYDRTFVAGSFRAAWRCRPRYYLALGATWVVLGLLVAQNAGARGASAGFGLGVDWWRYLLQQAEAVLVYGKLTAWPHPLVVDYGTAVATSVAPLLMPLGLVLLALAGTAWALVRRPVLGFFAGAWFLILAPSSSFVPLVTQTMAEHRVYLALALPIVAFAAGLHQVHRAAAWVGCGLALALGVVTAARVRVYHDSLSLWAANVAAWPSGARGHNNFALALHDAGKPAAADVEFARAVALDSRYVTAHYDWGVTLLQRGRLAEAIRELSTTVALAPDHADAQVNLGNALVRVGQPAEAVSHYQAALRLRPAADAYFDLGVALRQMGNDREAAAALQSALALDPLLPEAHFQLGLLARDAGDFVRAQAEWEQTLRSAPEHAGAHRELGLAAAQAGDFATAAAHFRALVRLVPDDADAHANLGNVFLLQGNKRDAITEYEAALRLRPTDPRLRESLELARR